MKRAVIFLLGIIVVVTSQDVDTCIDTVNFYSYCCNFKMDDDVRAALRQCYDIHHDLDSCEFQTCYGEKRGFVLSNGTIDNTLLSEDVSKALDNNTEIYDAVEEKCFVGDLSDYGYGDTCYLKEFGTCLNFQAMLRCPSSKWFEGEECVKVKETIKDCETIFP